MYIKKSPTGVLVPSTVVLDLKIPFDFKVELYPPQFQVSGVCFQLHVNLSELQQSCSLDNQATPVAKVISPAQPFLWPLPVIVPASLVQLW